MKCWNESLVPGSPRWDDERSLFVPIRARSRRRWNVALVSWGAGFLVGLMIGLYCFAMKSTGATDLAGAAGDAAHNRGTSAVAFPVFDSRTGKLYLWDRDKKTLTCAGTIGGGGRLDTGGSDVVMAEAPEAAEVPARDAAKKNPIPADEGSWTTGKKIYASNCAPCHGVSGKGDGPVAPKLENAPKDLTNPNYAKETDGSLYWKISNGHHPMPQFSNTLPEESRWNLVNYVRTLNKDAAAEPGARDKG